MGVSQKVLSYGSDPQFAHFVDLLPIINDRSLNVDVEHPSLDSQILDPLLEWDVVHHMSTFI